MSARLFVYTSDKALNHSEYSEFSRNLQEFINDWKAHGNMLDASFMLIANRVLLIVVDEKSQTATGCSIDSLNRYLQSSAYDWFCRNWVLHTSIAPSIDCDWEVSDLGDFHNKCRSGEISLDEFVLNTTVLSIEDLYENLIQKVSDSWHNDVLEFS
jgi:hypothetical protein